MKKEKIKHIDKLYTQYGAACQLGRSTRWLQMRQKEGEIMPVAVNGNRLLYSPNDVQRLIDKYSRTIYLNEGMKRVSSM